MKLSKYDYEVLSQLDELLLSENESVRELLQQAMVMQVLSKDDDDDKLKDKVIGPFQKMMIALRSAEDRLNALEVQMRNQDRNNATTGGYWSDNTSSPYPTLSGVSPVWQTGLGPTMTHGNTTTSLDKDYIDKLSQWVKTVPTKSVTATAAADPDAMVLVDPDTGHKMYVK
jgi:hypothetical protein